MSVHPDNAPPWPWVDRLNVLPAHRRPKCSCGARMTPRLGEEALVWRCFNWPRCTGERPADGAKFITWAKERRLPTMPPISTLLPNERGRVGKQLAKAERTRLRRISRDTFFAEQETRFLAELDTLRRSAVP